MYSQRRFAPQRTDRLAKSREAIDRALAIEPNLSGAHWTLGWLLMGDRDYFAAEPAFARSVELGPRCDRGGSPLVGFLAPDIDTTIYCMRQEVRDDPLSLNVSERFQMTLFFARRFDEMEAEYDRSRDLIGDRLGVESLALDRLWITGERKQIAAQIERVRALGPSPFFERLFDVWDDPEAARAFLRAELDTPVDPERELRGWQTLADWLGAYGDDEGAALALRRHVHENLALGNVATMTALVWLKPQWEGARAHPMTRQTFRELGWVDYWRESGNWPPFCRPLGAEEFECS